MLFVSAMELDGPVREPRLPEAHDDLRRPPVVGGHAEEHAALELRAEVDDVAVARRRRA